MKIAEKNLSVWFFVLGVTIKFDDFAHQNSVVFVTKNFWVFISYTVHEHKQIDMCINNINGVINKNLSLFSFPSDIIVYHCLIRALLFLALLSMEGETKTARIDKKPTFFIFLFFFLKIQNIRKSKTLIFERRYHKTFLGQMLTIFQRSLQIVVELWNNAYLLICQTK